MTYLCNKNRELKSSWNSAAAGRDYTVCTPPGKFALSHCSEYSALCSVVKQGCVFLVTTNYFLIF